MIDICYRKVKKHYKYKLYKPVNIQTGILGYYIQTPFLYLFRNGELAICQGYSWNGADWPAIDTKSIMSASLVHDGLCQLVKMGLLPKELIKQINNIMIAICEEKKMSRIRMKRIRWAINRFCNPRITEEEKKLYYA